MDNKKDKNKSPKVEKKDIQELVIARLLTLPEGKSISIGSEGEFDKYELIDHVKREDNIGKKVVEVQLSYLRSLKHFTDRLLKDE